MIARRAAVVAAALTVGLMSMPVVGSGGWSVSEIVRIEAPRYSVSGATPGCEEELVVERGLRWLSVTAAAVAALVPGDERPTALAERMTLAAGDLTYRIGSPMVLQRHAVCATVCAPIPPDARSVSDVRGFHASPPGEPFREMPVGVWGNFIRWDDDVDTTRVTADARWVCVGVRNWLDAPREAFFLVRYER